MWVPRAIAVHPPAHDRRVSSLRLSSLARLFALTVTTALLAACGGNVSSGSSPIPGTGAAQSVARTVSASALAATPTPTPNPCYCPPRQRICSDIACLAQPQAPANAALPADARAALATPTPTPNPCYCPPHHICSDIACLAQPRGPANAVLDTRSATASKRAGTP